MGERERGREGSTHEQSEPNGGNICNVREQLAQAMDDPETTEVSKSAVEKKAK